MVTWLVIFVQQKYNFAEAKPPHPHHGYKAHIHNTDLVKIIFATLLCYRQWEVYWYIMVGFTIMVIGDEEYSYDPQN